MPGTALQPVYAHCKDELRGNIVADFEYYVALDGNGINGFEGAAGVGRFQFCTAEDRWEFGATYYPGMAAGHALAINPTRTTAFLGSASQQILLFDPKTLEELERVSTLRFEPCDSTIRGTTHAVWLDDQTFLAAMGEWIYQFNSACMDKPERLMPHGLKLPHSMRRTASGRYLCIGGMDHPTRGEAREVAILDLVAGTTAVINLPATCWHLVTHPRNEVVYAISFRVVPQEYRDYQQWAIAFLKEYAFEIDVESKAITRHWSASRDTPAHLNSDVAISETELIWSNAASHTVTLLDLESFSSFRTIDERPAFRELFMRKRSVLTQLYECLARGSWYSSNHHLLTALRVSRFIPLDSIYGTCISADQSLLFTANRGLNRITVYDYPALTPRLSVDLPEIQTYLPSIGKMADPRLGLHHSVLLSS